jgi:putative ABC transport system permease protein
MLYHHLKIALRNLYKNRTFALINILGLAIGLGCCIIIGLYVYSEISFDKFHSKHSQIFRVDKVTNEKGKATNDAITPGLLAENLPKEIPEVSAATRFRPWFTDMLVSYDTIHLKLDDVAYTDNSFLQIFDFSLMEGDRKTALEEPFTAVITQSTAKKYFKDSNPIGKTLVTLNNIPVKITAVAKDVAYNSSLKFTMLISWGTISAPSSKNYFFWMDNWTTNVNYTFVQLKENTNIGKVGEKISALQHKHRDETEFQYRIFLQSLDDIHLHSGDISYAEQFRTNSNKIVYSLLIIAIFILLIACFNFINLTTAGVLGRAKETGVQKVLGATQFQLIKKFFSESFVLCLIAFVLAILLVMNVLPFFNSLADTNIDLRLMMQSKIILSFIGLLALISLMAGLYPAIFLSKFKSTDVFRNIIKAGKNVWLRQSLVTTQFSLSIFLIIATIVVNKQMKYLATKDLGFDKERIAIIQLANTNIDLNHKSAAFVNALRHNPGIIDVSASNRVPGQSFNGYGIIPEGHTLNEHMLANVLETDVDFAKTYNIQLSNGRFFSSQLPTDTANSIVINEAMARYLNWREPVGKQFEIYEARKGHVIGVMKDFHFASLRETVQPLAIILNDNPLYVSVKIRPGSVKNVLADIEKQWKHFDKEFPFDYFFIDEQLNKYYQADARLLKVLSIFASLAILIACMGLFGLSIYTAKQRTKEIGIRKVLGASITNVTLLLSKDFLRLVVIASVIAFPVSWLTMNNWLQGYAYRVGISAWIFVLAGLLAILIALITISFQAIKAAIANPVTSLRSE